MIEEKMVFRPVFGMSIGIEQEAMLARSIFWFIDCPLACCNDGANIIRFVHCAGDLLHISKKSDVARCENSVRPATIALYRLSENPVTAAGCGRRAGGGFFALACPHGCAGRR